MGYSHYWYRPRELDAGAFAAWASEVFQLVGALPVTVTAGAGQYRRRIRLTICGEDGTGAPIITSDLVCFNGDAHQAYPMPGTDNCAHERFFMPRVLTGRHIPFSRQRPDLVFASCKTLHRPYDLLVTAALIRLLVHFPECILRSDGDDEPNAWEPGRALCERLFGAAVLPDFNAGSDDED